MAHFQYLLEKINRAKIKTYPFEYLCLDNFLKPKDYKLLINEIPTDKKWSLVKNKNTFRRKSWQNQTYTINHKEYNLINEFSNLIESREFSDALFRLFNIKKKYINGTFKTAWCRDYDGFAIPPHQDQNDKIISCLFYLARNNRTPKNGTQICTSIKKYKKTNRHLRWLDFKKVKDIDYIKNRFVCWGVNSKSFHSVDIKIDINSKYPFRDTVRGFYFKDRKKLPQLYSRY